MKQTKKEVEAAFRWPESHSNEEGIAQERGDKWAKPWRRQGAEHHVVAQLMFRDI